MVCEWNFVFFLSLRVSTGVWETSSKRLSNILISNIRDWTRICDYNTADYVVEANNIPIAMCHHCCMLCSVYGVTNHTNEWWNVIPTRFPLVVNLMWSIHKHSRIILSLSYSYFNLLEVTKVILFSTELSQSNEKKHMVPSRSFPANHVHLQPKSFRVSIESHLQFQGSVLQRSLAFKTLSPVHLFVATYKFGQHALKKYHIQR